MAHLNPVVPATVPCKCCNAAATLYGVVDFHKNCEDRRQRVLEFSGVPVYYHRCPSCGFLFTAAFDTFTHDDFRAHIYNDQYARVDPDYADARPAHTAQLVGNLLGENKSIRILDYGGGNGTLAARLRASGFGDVTSYDPFVPESSARPEGEFDLVTCFEVMEHAHRPREVLADIVSFLKRPGIALISTLLQPEPLEQAGGVAWWYVAPRNGHVSIFSRRSVELLAGSLGCGMGSFDGGLHVVARKGPIPTFAQRWFNSK